MNTTSMVISTSEMRLEQTIALVEWLIAKDPDDESLARVLESVQTALILLRNIEHNG